MKTHDISGGDRPVLSGRSRRRAAELVAHLGPVDTPTSGRPDTVAVYEDQLHAVRSGLAALAGAVHALTCPGLVPVESRPRLEALALDEIERLQRLVAVDAAAAPEPCPAALDLDPLLGHVVLCRRLAGQDVSWRPSGLSVVGSRDTVTEILNILLVNAAEHAPGTVPTIEVVDQGSTVQVSVTDHGPGLPLEVRRDVFGRGTRGTASRGQGVGLAMAKELAESIGGRLHLGDVEGSGARFELRLISAAALDGVA